ncbi:Rho guanine nucleotide exchange factor [Quillaja saponaria]|uniref:Rho guanine nucleotide exchange factor n=1 Tax=Quillaja saponaria TaxID=32244 RepID=A0AAD7P9T8_QUISA|nr:Rho guanine nucleotide exchange factor [Quillaja saponaria]
MSSSITLKQLQDFHTIDRKAFARLVLHLGWDPYQSAKVVAFWNWLEAKGYRYFVKNVLPFSDELFNALAYDAITCLNYLSQNSLSATSIVLYKNVPLMPILLGKEFSVETIFKDREIVKFWIQKYIKNVCERVFRDIVPQNLAYGSQALVPIQDSLVPLQCGSESNLGYKQECFHSHMAPTVLASPNYSIWDRGTLALMPKTADTVQTQAPLLEEDRTLFVTFSKGHYISKEELRELLNRKFGNCVESIHMKVSTKMPSLFATVVLNSPSDVAEILGGKRIAKYSINGKDVWAKRYIQWDRSHLLR